MSSASLGEAYMPTEEMLQSCIRFIFFHQLPQQLLVNWADVRELPELMVNFNSVSKSKMARFSKLSEETKYMFQNKWKEMQRQYDKFTESIRMFMKHIYEQSLKLFEGKKRNVYISSCVAGNWPSNSVEVTSPSINLLLFIYENNK